MKSFEYYSGAGIDPDIPSRERPARYIVLCPATGARLCTDRRWYEFTYDVGRVKVYKSLGHAKRAAMNTRLRHAMWPGKSSGLLVRLPGGWELNAAGDIFNAERDLVIRCSDLLSELKTGDWRWLVTTCDNELSDARQFTNTSER